MEGYRTVILETLFPTRCVACQADGSWCCSGCISEIEMITRDLCSTCARPTASKHICKKREEQVILDSLLSVGFYHDPPLRTLIHRLKYDHGTCLLPSIANIVSRWKNERLESWPWAGEASLHLQPIPASPERVRQRGFDQAELIAQIVREQLVPWGKMENVLVRASSSGQSQADLEPGPLRQANMRGVFSVAASVIPESVLLIDDVYTTGATMKEAARMLRDAGVRRIYGFALALGA